MVGPTKITRRGVVRTLTIDHDAAALLEELAPHCRGLGRYVSELIRNEQVRKEERARIRAAVELLRREEQERVQAACDRLEEAAVVQSVERALG
jgi:hypothetical protein